MKRIALLVLFLAVPVPAQAPRDLPVDEVIVFKNGLAFVSKQGRLDFRGGEARVTPVPEALLGTLWIAAGDRAIDSVRASTETAGVESAATSIGALLDANVGRVATLLVDDREYTGKLLAAPAAEEAVQPSPRHAMSVDGWNGGPVAADRLVLLEIAGKTHVFNRASVKSVAFAAPVLRVSMPVKQTALTIHARGADGAEPATIRYLRSGLSWVPEYTVDLLDDTRARLSMRATLINEGEDLRDTRVRFAVGYPNFGFAGMPSPMTLRQGLQELLSMLSRDPSGMNNRFDNSITSQAISMNMATGAGNDSMTFPAPPATGESAEDLFFYEKNGVVLAKGERAMFPILERVVPLRHVYRWSVPDDANSPARDQVWHSIALTNDGSTPWTTAPALVVSNAKPLAQDTLAYTAAGAPGEVRLTIATDVAVEREETEVERKPRAMERGGYSYASVVVEGELTLRNYKRERIEVEVTKTIEGESTQGTPKAEVTRVAAEPNAINVRERLDWQVPVAAGGKVTLRYRYKVWVRE